MKLHDFCTKFQHSIVFLIEVVLYAACLVTFFLMFAIDNPEIIVMSRTAAVTLSTFVIMLVLLTFMYGKYDAGRRRWGQVALAVSITVIFTDLITYLELSIMKTNEANNTTFRLENIGILFLVFVIQILLIMLLSYAGEAFYFWINPKEKCLIITEDTDGARRVAEAFSSFEKKYEVSGIVSYKDPGLESAMVAADTIVLYELPVKERTEIVDFCYQNLKNIYFNPSIADILEQNSHSVIMDDISLFTTRYHMITFEERLVKRFMDTFISLIALIITSPVILVSAICIKKHDGGSVFFKQKRATVHGKVFEIINNAHINVLTTLYDANTTVMWETMSMGVPTMTLDHCGMHDIINERIGIKIPIQSYNQVCLAIKNEIANLILNPERKIRLAKNLIAERDKYTWNSRRAFFEEMYVLAKNNHIDNGYK